MKALILMTRIPIPGKTKTRLMEILTGRECAEIHKCFLLDLFYVFEFLKDDIDIFLTYTPEDSLNKIKDMLPEYIQHFPQEGSKLGDRMSNAIGYVFKKGYDHVLLIGSDIPDIKVCEIKDAFEILKDKDICIGPTFDGGYYLIGMKKLYTELFHDSLKWGNKTVLEGTLDIANNLDLKVGIAAKHMDIDTKEDLFALKERIDNGSFDYKESPWNTINFVNRCWSDMDHVKRQAKG
ncbi:glycosyltransferase [Crassaminicella thermophila]|uniref:Glycosyltransferase n=1 Tax=Crassaminicella thermophila TaxID=2599308 RepID=A0A5C0SEW6_CRATE|nr:TIGR04282 family arsenosugar biosynthesis glycosyltransferase [Crassaminicella thermophila]QEK12983.1 glycosyltransferase [Crassaminicella thermophila]